MDCISCGIEVTGQFCRHCGQDQLFEDEREEMIDYIASKYGIRHNLGCMGLVILAIVLLFAVVVGLIVLFF